MPCIETARRSDHEIVSVRTDNKPYLTRLTILHQIIFSRSGCIRCMKTTFKTNVRTPGAPNAPTTVRSAAPIYEAVQTVGRNNSSESLPATTHSPAFGVVDLWSPVAAAVDASTSTDCGSFAPIADSEPPSSATFALARWRVRPRCAPAM